MRPFLSLAIATIGVPFTALAEPVAIRSAQIWPAADGEHINAHCGHIVEHNGVYYWFGENRRGDRRQITCYSSANLRDWSFRNTVLKDLGDEKGFTERPKVVFNDRTRKWVMWMHKEGQGGYDEARAAVAVSDTIDGDYRFLGSFRPLGNMSRDDYLFKDDDGAAYFVSASNNNADLKLYRLSDDYLKIDHEVATLFAGQYREAPVILKRDGLYYLLTSFCTGAKSNPQYYSVAKSIAGPWSENRPLTAPRTWNTYYSQGACAFPVRGTQGTTWVYNLDRWVRPMRHVWLPLEFNEDGTIKPLEWHDEWRIDASTGLAEVPPAPEPLANNLAKGHPVSATYDSPGEMFDFGHFANHEPTLATDGDPSTAWSTTDNLPHWLRIDLEKPTDVDAVEFSFWKKGLNDFRVEASSNGEEWRTIAKGRSALDQDTVRNQVSESGVRYLRVWLLGSNRGYNWPGIGELAVFSKGSNIAPGKPVTADNFQARTDASKAVDGDFSTAWTIDDEKLPQSLAVDLGSVKHVGGVRILWEATGVAHRYRVETSTDAKKWSPIVDETAGTAASSQPEHRFDASARFVRLTLVGYDDMGGDRSRNMRPWPGVREFEILP